MLTRKRISLILIFLIFAVGWIFYQFPPQHYSFYPTCIFKNITGLSCPGCGSQRAFHELLHFNLKNAFYYNPIFIILLPYGVILILFRFTSLQKNFPKIYQILTARSLLFLILIVILLFGILRNI